MHERSSRIESRESFAGLSVLALGIAIAVSVCIFILIAADVTNDGALASLDVTFNVWLHQHQTVGLTKFLYWVSTLHSNWIAGILTLAICVYLWRRRLSDWGITFLATIFGGMVLNMLLKMTFARERPRIEDEIFVSRSYSFPSGHTMLATVFYGTLCVFLMSRLRTNKSRALTLSLTIFMIALVGFSRMYLGAHHLTDVLAAVMEGVAWIAGCLLMVETRRRRRST